MRDHFPTPFLDRIVDEMAGHHFYSFMDDFSGYNQLPIHPEDNKLTAFCTPYGIFAYNILPFGLYDAKRKLLKKTFKSCHEAFLFATKLEKELLIDLGIAKVDFDQAITPSESFCAAFHLSTPKPVAIEHTPLAIENFANKMW
ncbi:uncharacterized protein LOC112347485 [Selaginella moellendorffii]|uniref:uncharacterized protein LOC112347485 n=1 Tax=Selaginella moellendorffii TaxID=88036 RepID=UPI000D1C47A0|nr:uncharacterized protein LOC112347485 [Selaginella moellendorffii]|eukprot:XP_024534189.1 uncharacterized protein LOC112347485 [Selaginella moellendorffii]